MTFSVVHTRPLAFARRLDSVAKSAQWQGKGSILTRNCGLEGQLEASRAILSRKDVFVFILEDFSKGRRQFHVKINPFPCHWALFATV